MLKALALATLTAAALPQPAWTTSLPVQQSTSTSPLLGAKTLEMDLAHARLKAFDKLSEDRRVLRADLIEKQSMLRTLRRSLEDSTLEYDREIERRQVRLDRADDKLADATAPDPDHTASHSIRAIYEQLQAARNRAKDALDEVQTRKRQLLMAVEEDIVALEQDIAQIEGILENQEQRMQLQQEFLRAERELELAQSNLIKPSTPSVVVDDFRAARIAAAVAGKPLLVNFTAHTSVNGRRMEALLFGETPVATELEDFVEARLHSDSPDRELRLDIEERARSLAGTEALPVYVVLDPRGGRVLGRHEGASLDAAAFAEFLASSKAPLGGTQPPATDSELWGRIFDLEDEVARLRADVKKAAGAAR